MSDEPKPMPLGPLPNVNLSDTLPAAPANAANVAWQGDTTTGNISASYPAATATALGGVKVGANVSVAADGTLSVAAPPNLSGYALLDSPAFTGTPTVQTPPAGSATGQIANTAWVAGYYYSANYINSTYAPLNAPVFTGNPSTPTAPPANDSSAAIPNTWWVRGVLGGYALLNSPAFTGNPSTPTPVPNDNTGYIPNTAWVQQLLTNAFGFTANSPGAQSIWGGLKLQWGGTGVGTGNGDIVAYTAPFPNNVFVVLAMDIGTPSTGVSSCNSVSAQVIPTPDARHLTSFRVFVRKIDGTQAYTPTVIYWFAIGN